MNRLVIIGNGFDLAHGLPTRYKDFIDDFWRNFKDKKDTDEYKEILSVNQAYNAYYSASCKIENFLDFKLSLSKYCKENNYDFFDVDFRASTKPFAKFEVIFAFKNEFFKSINIKNSENWVDIENEYYRQLKNIVKEKPLDNFNTTNIEIWGQGLKRKAEKLNFEFEQVKKLLEKYLNKIDENQSIKDDILKHFELIKTNVEKYFSEFSKQDKKELENFQNEYNIERKIGENIMTYCLNFNYTQTIDNYIGITKQYGEYRNFGKFQNIHIHGRLNDIENKINFGFGDEMDDDYKTIEILNDNEYLKNFKSFQYLQNSNYKTLLDFIDSAKFQVLVMGHSCGLSDRTLLNTIFEHNNCRSIKVFYHQKEDEMDNYTEIIQNISRHFNKKKLMREKIVDKTLCEPLLRIKLTKK